MHYKAYLSNADQFKILIDILYIKFGSDYYFECSKESLDYLKYILGGLSGGYSSWLSFKTEINDKIPYKQIIAFGTLMSIKYEIHLLNEEEAIIQSII